jgi:2',3'-cyclic-nucleotide 2'-phosphodiesterase (5'-nucleotidase family)
MVKLRILYFNDVHSRFEELAKVASIVEELRDKNTVILDAGDNADFARLETEGTNGVISSAVLNRIGVDARVFGNNEGFAGNDNSRILSERSDCPVVTCNIYDLEDRKPAFLDDAVVLERSGVKVLIVGVTAGDWLNAFYELFGLKVKDPRSEIGRVLADYERFDYDLQIVLSHCGLEEDRKIASQYQNIDMIVGGHSHTVLKKPLVTNGVMIVQAGQFGEYLGEVVIDFDVEKKKVQRFKGRLISAKNYAPMTEIMELIGHYSAEADRNLSTELFSIHVNLDHSLTGENPLGNLLADALKDVLNAEIGIINSGVVTGGIGKGPITRKLLHKLCPSPLNPTYMEVKGADLRAALEKSLLKEFQLGDGRGPGSRTRYLGNLQVSDNVRIKVGSDKVRSITVDSRPLVHDRWYSIGTSDFLQRGTGYSELANNRNERYRPEFLRELLQTYLQKRAFLEKAFDKRFVVK